MGLLLVETESGTALGDVTVTVRTLSDRTVAGIHDGAGVLGRLGVLLTKRVSGRNGFFVLGF